MPLKRKRVLEKIDEKREEIKEFELKRQNKIDSYLSVIRDLDEERISDLTGFSGAKPLEEGSFVKEFNPSDIEEWVVGVLNKKVVAGVDGSQITPEKNYDIPVGLANSVLFTYNYRNNSVNRGKNISLITPNDFDLENSYSFSNRTVNAERDKLEREASIKFTQKGLKDSYIFLDGALVLTHANKMREKLREKYINKIISLLRNSKEQKVPVIGFVETSYSCDLIQMLDNAGIHEEKKDVYDAVFVNELLSEGDRTKTFICLRDDRSSETQTPVLARYGDFQNGVCFFYINLGGDLCCRIEFPRWCYEEGLVEEIADIVRAEAYKGNGYPMILNKAHKEAVINYNEKESFLKLIKGISNGNSSLKTKKKREEVSNVHW